MNLRRALGTDGAAFTAPCVASYIITAVRVVDLTRKKNVEDEENVRAALVVVRGVH